MRLEDTVRSERLLLLAGLAMVWQTACSQAVTMVGELRDVHAAVKGMGLSEDVAVHLMNGHRLGVQLINPKSGQASAAERKGQALQVARQAYERYGSKEKLSGVTVSYTERKRYLLLLNTETSQTHVFEVKELLTPAAAREAQPPSGGYVREMRGAGWDAPTRSRG